MKLRIPKVLEDKGIVELLLKATEEIEKYEFSDLKWIKEYQIALIEYLEDVFKAVADGLALKFEIDPTTIQKSFKVPYDILIKAANGEEVEDALFYKSIFDELKKKYGKKASTYKKFGFNGGASLQPAQIKGRVTYSPDTKKWLTKEEWNNLTDSVTDFLSDHLKDTEDKLIVRAGLFGLLAKKMEDEGVPFSKVKGMSYDDIEKRFGKLDDKKVKDEVSKNKQLEHAIEFSKRHAGEYLSIQDGSIKTKIVNIVRNQVTGGLQDGLNVRQLVSRLYKIQPSDELGKRLSQDTVDAASRDWRRVAITEFNMAMNNGYLAAHKDGAKKNEKLYFVYAGRFSPTEKPNESCNKFLGKICLLVDNPRGSDKPKKGEDDCDYVIWEGKTNVGRTKKNQWICIPTHPHCTHRWQRFYPDFQQWNPEINKIEYKVEKSKSVKLDLLKSKDITIENVEWKDKERVRNIQKELPILMRKVKKYVDIKSPVVVHLYKSPNDQKRAEYDLGTIIIYTGTPQWRGDFLHELGHQIFRPENLDHKTKVELIRLKKELRKTEGDRRVFMIPHLYDNIKEILATLFKWWIQGKLFDPAYTNILKKYCPKGFAIVDSLLKKGKIEKSSSDLVFFSEEELLKAFISPPKTHDGKIDFAKMPLGSTIWITKEGRHIPITKYSKDRFAVDFQAARNAGYTYKKVDKEMAHLTFKIDPESGRPVERQPKEAKVEKELTPKQIERQKIKEHKRELKRTLKLEKNKSQREVIKMVTDRAKDEKEVAKLMVDVEKKISDYGLTPEQKETYVDTIVSEALKRKREQRLEEANDIAKGRGTSDATATLNLVRPEAIKDKLDLINKIKDGLSDKSDNSITINTGIHDSVKKKIDKKELKEKIDVLQVTAAQEKGFFGTTKNATKEDLEKIEKVGVKELEVSEEEVKQAEKLFQKNKNNSNGKSLYTILSRYYEDDGTPQVQYLANKAAERQISALMTKFTDTQIDIKRMMDTMGVEKTAQLLAIHLKNKLSDEEYNAFKQKVAEYFTNESQGIEDKTLQKFEMLRIDNATTKGKITRGDVYHKEAERRLTENLIEQRNLLGASFGQLQSTSEFLNALKSVEKTDKVVVDLSDNEEAAMNEYKNFTFAQDRDSTKIVKKFGSYKMEVSPKSLDKFYIKESKVDRQNKEKLNAIKTSKDKVVINKHGEEVVPSYKIPGFKKDFVARVAQRNDIEFLKATGGKGIIARTTGGGKTFTAIGFHSSNLAKNPSYSTIFVVPDKMVGGQMKEIKGVTDLKHIEVPEGMNERTKRIFLKKVNTRGKILVISHSDLAKHNDILQHKKFNNLTIDEPHQVFFDSNGDMKSKGRLIANRIKTEHKVALTATPIQTNPADVYNLVNWVDEGGAGKRGNFRRMFGDKEKYDLNGIREINDYSISDMDVGKSNLMRDYFRDVVDKYVSNDEKVVRNYDVNKDDENVTMPVEMKDKLKRALNARKKGLNKYITDTPKWYKKQYPGSWQVRRESKYVEGIVTEQIKLSNRVGGSSNPKTRKLIRNIRAKRDEKHVVYVDDSKHQEHVMSELIKRKYPKEQIYTMLGSKANANTNKENFKKSDKPGVLFISRQHVAGHNLQEASTMHKVGTILTGMDDIQADGRLPRGPRDSDVYIKDYRYNTIYENNIRHEIRKYVKNLSAIDSSIARHK